MNCTVIFNLFKTYPAEFDFDLLPLNIHATVCLIWKSSQRAPSHRGRERIYAFYYWPANENLFWTLTWRVSVLKWDRPYFWSDIISLIFPAHWILWKLYWFEHSQTETVHAACFRKNGNSINYGIAYFIYIWNDYIVCSLSWYYFI